MVDVAVVGGGVAGCELALRLDRAGRSVVLVTTSLDTVYTGEPPFLDVSELTGVAAKEAAALQPDVDRLSRWELHTHVKQVLEQHSGVHLMQSSVEQLVPVANGWSVETWEGVPIEAERVVLAVGTFLNAALHVGRTVETSGRLGEIAYPDLFHWLQGRDVPLERHSDAGKNDDDVAWTRHYWAIRSEGTPPFAVPGLPGVHAIGRCRTGCTTYEATVADATALADHVINNAVDATF